MQVRHAANIHAFYERVYGFLLTNEAAHNLMFGILAFLKAQPSAASPPWLITVEDETVLGVAIRTPPHNLLLSQVADLAALEVLATDLWDKDLAPPGVLGPRDAARAFCEHWQEASGQRFSLKRAQRIYRLTRVSPPAGVPGSFRQATVAEQALLTRWCTAFSLEALGEARDDAKAARVVESYLADGRLYLWERGNKVVSMAGSSGPTPNGIRVNLVYTPPEHRGHGYASTCVAALSAELLTRHRCCFLFTDLANPTSNHIYQQIGYEPVTDVDEYTFSPV